MYEEYLVLTNVAERTKPVDTPMIKSRENIHIKLLHQNISLVLLEKRSSIIL